MAQQGHFVGTVVEQDPKSPFPSSPGGGLYLLSKDGQVLALVGAHMATQMPVDVLHIQGRSEFEQYIGKTVTVQGYLSGRTIYSAVITDMP